MNTGVGRRILREQLSEGSAWATPRIEEPEPIEPRGPIPYIASSAMGLAVACVLAALFVYRLSAPVKETGAEPMAQATQTWIIHDTPTSQITNLHIDGAQAQFSGNQFAAADANRAPGAVFSAGGKPIPQCNRPTQGALVCVNDSTNCVTGNIYVSGGAFYCMVWCDDNNWKESGSGC